MAFHPLRSMVIDSKAYGSSELLNQRRLGATGLPVSRLGAGLSEIGYRLTLDRAPQAGDVLNIALDGGINFFDTAACYRISEELIGRTIAHRRGEFVLATKAGHATAGYCGRDWEAATITDSIERSLLRMRTDYLDIVHLHSCGVDVLERGEAIEALETAKRVGKTRFIGYSGDNEAAEWAVASGRFDTLQTSYNLVDQKAGVSLLDRAKAVGMGVIAKRPIANAAWGVDRSPSEYAVPYFHRAVAMAACGESPSPPDDPVLLALGFVLANESVDTAIVGTHRPEHMRHNLGLVGALPIPDEVVRELKRRFDLLGGGWAQLT